MRPPSLFEVACVRVAGLRERVRMWSCCSLAVLVYEGAVCDGKRSGGESRRLAVDGNLTAQASTTRHRQDGPSSIGPTASLRKRQRHLLVHHAVHDGSSLEEWDFRYLLSCDSGRSQGLLSTV